MVLKNRARLLLVALLSGLLIGVTGTVAAAVVASSNWANVGTFDNVQHSHRSAIENPPKRATGTARAATVIGAGRLGVNAWVLNSSTAVCASSGVVYSSYATAAFSASTTSGNCGTGNHRASGISYHYNGATGSYACFQIIFSPYQAW